MSFATGYLSDPTAVGAGEPIGALNMVLSASDFEDGLKIGRFAKLDTGSLDNIDSSSTPVIAGVVIRDPARAVEDGGEVNSDLYNMAQYVRQGIVTVDVVTGDTPSMFGAVFINNEATADAGKATTTDDADTEASNAEFLYEVQTDVWAIRLY